MRGSAPSTIGKPSLRRTAILSAGVGILNQCRVGTAFKNAPASGWLTATSLTASLPPAATISFQSLRQLS